ncbi:MAG TPA: CdaR family protein [Methylomusa anaerophila]|uniref:YbbR-like protein n=1 Tax=Methylomusa anaerophila TaxID=1930071 RepID=A0A348AK27_9FIRM|nr:CdaR family protein [Methylomusa anaerophila]BBB91425.1 YbbR-like protein [Methylomusa anaerophila]HML90151.1 CdaR family protein [Methylomusa anaerophila]
MPDNKKRFRDITTKIIAVIIAIVLWLYVMNEQNPPIEAYFTVPLEIRKEVANQVVFDAPEAVRVKVRGPRSTIAGIINREINAFIDLKGVPEGRQSLKVGAAIPASLELIEISPDRIMVRIDTTISRTVPVVAAFTGAATKGMIVEQGYANVDAATVEGPKNSVNMVDKVVANIDLSGRVGDFSGEVPLIPVTKDGKEVDGVSLSPAKTRIEVKLSPGISKKVLDIKPVVQGDLPKGLVLKSITTEPDKVEVSEEGEGKNLAKLDTIYTEPVNLTLIDKDTSREVKLQYVEGTTGPVANVIVHIKLDSLVHQP